MPTTSTRPIPRQRKFDHGVALELALQGWRNSEIAKRYGVSEPSVAQALAKYNRILNGLGPGEIQAYRNKRSDLFTAVERELMTSLTDRKKLAKASLNNVAYAFTQVHAARRLEEDKSTSNTASMLHAMIDTAHSQLFGKRSAVVERTEVTQPTDTPLDDPIPASEQVSDTHAHPDS